MFEKYYYDPKLSLNVASGEGQWSYIRSDNVKKTFDFKTCSIKSVKNMFADMVLQFPNDFILKFLLKFLQSLHTWNSKSFFVKF